ncbi:MAG: hypothetical protein V2A61_05860 [Calditrichota bacterium]
MIISFEYLQPSQLYICSEKLEAVQREFRQASHLALYWTYPIIKINNRHVLTDRHTHALVAFNQGVKLAIAYLDEDDLDLNAYQVCVSWCLGEGVKEIGDLNARVLPYSEYQEKWIKRCQAIR